MLKIVVVLYTTKCENGKIVFSWKIKKQKRGLSGMKVKITVVPPVWLKDTIDKWDAWRKSSVPSAA